MHIIYSMQILAKYSLPGFSFAPVVHLKKNGHVPLERNSPILQMRSAEISVKRIYSASLL